MIDIDYFKAYNDYYGHAQGDSCLQEVAQTLSSGLRRTVDFVARYGGEEFAVILPETDEENAHSAAEHLRQEVEDRRILHESSPGAPYVTISVGAATVVPSTKLSPYSLVEQADRALYLAKQRGRNRTAQYMR
jgi:diguanylate cyclase (GGDEF)-like protein